MPRNIAGAHGVDLSFKLVGADELIRQLDLMDQRQAGKTMAAACNDGAIILRKALSGELNKGSSYFSSDGHYHGSSPGDFPYRYSSNLFKSITIKKILRKGHDSYAIVGHKRGKFDQYRGPHAHLMEFGARHFNWGRPGVPLVARPYFKPGIQAKWNEIANAIISRLTRELYGGY